MRYLAVILAFLAIGCTPEPIDLEIPQAESKPVVGNQIVPDRGMLLVLTRSFSALSDGTQGGFTEDDLNSYLITDAVVTVDFNNRSVDLPELQPGLYFSLDVLQEEGVTYTLNVNDKNNKQTISASTTVLPPVAIQNGSAKIDPRPTGEKNLNLNFNFNDPVGANFYMFNVYINPRIPNEEVGVTPGFGSDIGGRKGGAPQSDFSGFGNVFSDYSETWLFTDEGLDGSNISKDITIFDLNVTTQDTIFYTLSNISEDYYTFLQSRERSNNTIPFVGEPATLPTNVEGGYGYFSMHYPVPYFLNIEE